MGDDWVIHHGDCREVMRGMDAGSVDAVVCDPPYGLSFMGKGWDHGVPGVEFWTEAMRVAKPGAHLLAFGGTRTFHRLACAIEDAGWELRDTIGNAHRDCPWVLAWIYGQGFPKSLDVSKAIDKAAGAEREVVGSKIGTHSAVGSGLGGTATGIPQMRIDVPITTPATDAAREWSGWGTALKPAWEPIIVARKPLDGTVAANVLRHGTGAINVDGCRIPHGGDIANASGGGQGAGYKAHNKPGRKYGNGLGGIVAEPNDKGRWPANVVHDGSDEVVAGFPESRDGVAYPVSPNWKPRDGWGRVGCNADHPPKGYGGGGSAARFFYCAKASRADREEGLEGFDYRARPTMGSGIVGQPDQQRQNNRNIHPTVKPTALMQWLVRLVTRPGGVVLDPFCGSGSTGKAAMREGMRFIGIEQDADYVDIARARVGHAHAEKFPLAACGG